MDLGLEGRSVIVMAASKGLGKATAKLFVKEGAHVVIASRNESELKKTTDEIIKETSYRHVNYVVCDITKPNEIKQVVAKAVEKNGTVDVLVNNSGGPPAGTFDDFDDQGWQNAFELNLLSFIRTTREVLPHMRNGKGGRIVNIASSSMKEILDHLILSNTFRAGIVGLSKSLSRELAKDNILINTVGPGRIATDRVTALDQIKAVHQNVSIEELKRKAAQEIPIKRYGEPKEFANMVVYLSSWANTYVTGQTLVVDGGMIKAL